MTKEEYNSLMELIDSKENLLLCEINSRDYNAKARNNLIGDVFETLRYKIIEMLEEEDDVCEGCRWKVKNDDGFLATRTKLMYCNHHCVDGSEYRENSKRSEKK